jgi:outer membrane lipoprotein carrier protein
MNPARAQWRGACVLLAVLPLAGLLDARQPSPSANSPSVEELAARVDHHYDSLRSLRAGFSENYTGMGMNRTESGTLLLAKPGRMRWDYSSPPGKVFLLDGKYGWFYTPGAPQVQRVAAKQLDDLHSPLRFLLGHTDLEKEISGLKESPDPAGHGDVILTGQPKGQEQRISRVALHVNPATGAIIALEIDETDGAITRFTFTSQQPDAALPPETFHFTPPPGVPVVDSLPPV